MLGRFRGVEHILYTTNRSDYPLSPIPPPHIPHPCSLHHVYEAKIQGIHIQIHLYLGLKVLAKTHPRYPWLSCIYVSMLVFYDDPICFRIDNDMRTIFSMHNSRYIVRCLVVTTRRGMPLRVPLYMWILPRLHNSTWGDWCCVVVVPLHKWQALGMNRANTPPRDKKCCTLPESRRFLCQCLDLRIKYNACYSESDPVDDIRGARPHESSYLFMSPTLPPNFFIKGSDLVQAGEIVTPSILLTS